MKLKLILGSCLIVVAVLIYWMLTATKAKGEDAKTGPEVAELKTNLLSRKDDDQGFGNMGATIKHLAEIGSPKAVKALEAMLMNPDGDQPRRAGALLALGKIGTKESINAISRWERWRITNSENPLGFKFGKLEPPIFHMGIGDLKPFAQCKDAKGVTWAVFNWPILPTEERYALWITKSTGPNSWSEPIYIRDEVFDGPLPWVNNTGAKKTATMVSDGGELVLKSEVRFDPRKYTTDADADGLTDAVEFKYRTRHTERDTDKDGIADKRDSNPLTPRQKTNGDLELIRQAAFAYIFNTTNSRMSILTVDDPKKESNPAQQEYYGYYGKILKRSEIEHGWENLREIKVTMESPKSAYVTVEEWWGYTCGSTVNLRIRKLHGRWVVVESLGGGVS